MTNTIQVIYIFEGFESIKIENHMNKNDFMLYDGA